MSSSRSRVVIIGLDGACPDLIQRWGAAGHLPNLWRLAQDGVLLRLRSTMPPVTAPAWVSFMTGKNPGKHGVFNFRNFDVANYAGTGEAATLASSSAINGETIFEIASRAERRVAAINVPVTYPPFPVNGVLVSGIPVVPDFRRAYTWPPELSQEIGAWSLYNRGVEELTREQQLQAIDFWTDKHTETAVGLMARERWDLLTVVLRNTDEAIHYFWWDDVPDAPGEVIREQYMRADEAVGRLVAAAPDDATVIVMSDHGAGPHPRRIVHLNAWFVERGMMVRSQETPRMSLAGALARRVRDAIPRQMRITLRDRLPQTLQERLFGHLRQLTGMDWGRTRAFRVPMFTMVEGVHFNVRGRQKEGIIAPGEEYEAYRERVVEELIAARDPATGEPFVSDVLRREDVYTGPFVDRAPDLLVQFRDGYTGGPGTDPDNIFEQGEATNEWSGTHRVDGVLIAWGSRVRHMPEAGDAHIEDVAPTALYLMGVPIPDDIDGRVLTEILKTGSGSPLMRAGAVSATNRDGGLTTEEQQQIAEQLKALGYV